MSKFKKTQNKKKLNKTESRENLGYKTVILTGILTGVLFFASLLFNGQIVTLSIFDNIFLNIAEIFIRTIVISLFFLSITISFANYRDLVGKPISWKELTLLFLLSIIQSILNIYVFLLSLIGLILILVYLYLIQE